MKRWVVSLAVVLAGLAAVFAYGWYIGFGKFEVNRIDLTFADLPPAFDGYRIVHFSDAHLGSFTGWREDLLRRDIDSIRAQKADMVVFTGDLQNRKPTESERFVDLLSTITAPDGVYSVLGNHDYTMYLKEEDPFIINEMLGRSFGVHYKAGWRILSNAHVVIERGGQSIIIAGMENDGEGRFPQNGNLNMALSGVHRDEFIIMLEHDPTSWRRRILPHSHCQLTLSGHTHGGQFSLFGWSPSSLRYREVQGLYSAGGGKRYLYVSRGIGGFIPWRLNSPAEITVITLHRSK